MKRGFALFLAAALIALPLTACGGGAMNVDSPSSASMSDSMGYGEGFYDDYRPDEPMEMELQAEEQDSRLANAKMIYTANIEAETMEFETCAADLEKLVDQLGGYLEFASSNSYGDGYRTGSYTARIPAARFNAFLKSIGDIGHVTYQDKSSENISERYYDIESRLTTQRTKLERLQALLARAENMEDIITIESAIAETELQIEQLTGSLRHYDALVDFSTVYIQLREVSRLSDVETAPPSFTSRLGAAFTSGLTGFEDFLQDLAIFLAYSWIWLLILAAILLLAVRAVKRGQVRREAERFGQPIPEKRGLFRRKRWEEPKNPDDKQTKD